MLNFFKRARKTPDIDPEKFCPIPFIQLQLTPPGKISTCCFSGEHKVGSILENSLEEIWNGEEIRKWRREFLEGAPKICEQPMKTFGCHRHYRHLIERTQLSEWQEYLPRRLDIRFNGQCNLECVMCDVWRQPNHLYDRSDFWSLGPTRIFPYLWEIDMLGGEPFIQKDTYRLIDEVTQVNSDCTWSFITNGQYKFNEKIRGALDRIKLRHIHFSMDSLDPETYPKIRVRGDFKRLRDTVDAVLDYRRGRRASGRGFQIFASLCVQRLNWREVPAFLKFCDDHEIQPVLQWMIVGSVQGRLDYSLETLPEAEKVEIAAVWRELAQGPHGEQVRSMISALGV